MQISAPFAGFLSVGLSGRHERKFSRHFKGLLRTGAAFADVSGSYGLFGIVIPVLPNTIIRRAAGARYGSVRLAGTSVTAGALSH